MFNFIVLASKTSFSSNGGKAAFYFLKQIVIVLLAFNISFVYS